MTVEYDGTHFSGWQVQQNGRSVQEELERALQQIIQSQVKIVGAGRTDAGVHAKGQVASFQLKTELDCNKILRGLNGVLPEDIVVIDLKQTKKSFHARYHAMSRVYEYTISRRPIAIGRLYAWEMFYKLETELLHRCAEYIVGTHNFEGFCKKGSSQKDFECTVIQSIWVLNTDLFYYTIEANRFVYGMVRALVGSMIEVARGAMTIDNFTNILQGKDKATIYAPAKGLCLTQVKYKEEQ